jgi:hypothetical protein
MRRGSRRLGVAIALFTSCFAAACAGPATPTAATAPVVIARAELVDLARRAVSPDRAIADPAITALRAAGPEGLDALFAAHPAAVARLGDPAAPPAPGDPDPARLRAALERVARQRDAHASRLYWYTDLAEAERAAKAAHKPILSLRLLGDLDDELSCANSRFFRTALYPNERIGRLLREGFVLHWKSERPAPRITIDFGDGRKMERTITGNSVHYVLDDEGRPVDALPGLHGPAAFLRGLERARGVALEAMARGGDEGREIVRAYHARARDEMRAAWDAELAALGVQPAPLPVLLASASKAPAARVAANTAPSKAAAEVPMVAALQGPVVTAPTPVDGRVWAALLARHADDARLDAASRRLMRRKIASELDASGAQRRPLDDAAFERRVAAFERTLAEDTVRNEYGMHRTLHEWMALSPPPDDLEALNQRVYATLFLTPRTDPWLGLLAPDSYSAIEGEGLTLGPSRGPAKLQR